MEKVLIITYYWPPSGGAGVQRWVKLSKYLSRMGLEVFVLTVDEKSASYLTLDESLNKEIDPAVKVIKTTSFEIINWYAKWVGKEKVPTAGFTNVDNQRLMQKLVNAIRSNFFIPDPRKGWNKYAIKKAVSLIEKEGIKQVITTSPPHSTQLIGLALKRKMGVEWIVDLRDPWTDIYYYPLLHHSFISDRINHSLEKQVLLESDHIITVSKGFRTLFMRKSELLKEEKFSIIPNGFDEEDFKEIQLPEKEMNRFVIAYTGTMSDQYEPQAFLNAIKTVVDNNQDVQVEVQFVGKISEGIKSHIKAIDLETNCRYIPPVSHQEAVNYQRSADLLLLALPHVEDSKGICPGKVFEYLAARKRILLIGDVDGDAAKIIHSCQAGKAFHWSDEAAMSSYLSRSIQDFRDGQLADNPSEEVTNYSRRKQAEQIKGLLLRKVT